MITKLENPEYLKFKKWVEETYPNEHDKIDFFSYFDSTLTLSENKGELLKSYPISTPFEDYKEAVKRNEAENAREARKSQTELPAHFTEILKNNQTIYVAGDRGQAKTAVSYYLASLMKEKGKKIYVLKHPKVEAIQKIGFNNLNTIDEIERLKDCCIILDEPQLILPKYEKRGSIKFLKLLSLARQRNISVIICTSDSRYVTASEESYITLFVIKRLNNYRLIKKGSAIKEILEEMAIITPEGYASDIKKEEYALYSTDDKSMNGRYSFEKPEWFTEELSKPFS